MPLSGHFLQTETALGCLEEKFSCNKCGRFAGSPVTLGGCEHIFCSTCCEDYLGAACPVCGIPAHVKDADVDRQLFNLATLCKRLRSELNMDTKKGDDFKENEDPQIQGTPNQPIPGSFSHHNHVTDQSHVTADNVNLEERPKRRAQNSPKARKRDDGVVSEIKMGPRNKKRLSVETEIKNGVMGSPVLKSKVTNTDSKLSDKSTGKRQRLAIKTPSTNSPSKKRRSLPAEQTTMTQFYEYDEENEGFNIEEEDPVDGHVEFKDKTDKPVKTQKGKRRIKSDSKKDGSTRTTRLRHSLDSNIGRLKDVVTTPDKTSVSEPAGSIKKDIAKGKQNKSSKATKGKRNENIVASDEASRKEDQGKQSDDAAGKTTKKLDDKESNLDENIPAQSPSTPATARPKTKSTPRTPVGTPKGRQLQSQMKMSQSPALNKRNAKGETPLQVAAIKNEIFKVRQLLTEGANPNVRDNAGWTPLHEACNHGYLEVAKLLLDHGAMINIPGLENDTPLHDAINNGRLDCVKLLVSRGASLTLRNMHGQTAHDLAVTPEMKKALKTAVISPDNTQNFEPVDILKYQSPCLLGTGLSREEKVALQKAANQLQVKLADEVSPEVTHIVTKLNSEAMCPRTVKIVQGILLGKWILSMEWLETCSRMGSLVCEEAFEAQGTSLFPGSEAPSKGRLNRINQLPGLFDGCHFYFHGTYEYATPAKEDLINIVTAGGGKILSREPKPGHLDMAMTVPYHVDSGGELARCCVFIVHEDQVKFKPIRTKFMCSVPSSWLMDCASNFKFGKLPSVN